MSSKQAVVGIVIYNKKILLGLYKQKGDRYNRWVFPGGQVEARETLAHAVKREVYEETGIRCIPKEILKTENRDGKAVTFILCKATSSETKDSYELAHVSFFTRQELRAIKLYENVLDYLEMAQST